MVLLHRFRVLIAAVATVCAVVPFCRGQEQNAATTRAKSFLESGNARVAQGDYLGAIVDFSSALELEPKNPVLYAARGNAKTNLGELDEAISDFSRAIEIDPARRVPYINRGVAKVDKGDLNGAIADYSKAIDLDPKNITAYRNRGCARQQKGDLDGARADYQQAIQLATDDGAYQRFYLFLLVARQKPGPSLADMKATVSRWKTSWKKNVGLFLAGEIDEAALHELAAQGSPKTVREQKCEAFYYAGVIHLLKGDAVGAKNLFERCVATQLHTFPEFQLARAELNNIGQDGKQ
jgi:lipoprotein NlpI